MKIQKYPGTRGVAGLVAVLLFSGVVMAEPKDPQKGSPAAGGGKAASGGWAAINQRTSPSRPSAQPPAPPAPRAPAASSGSSRSSGAISGGLDTGSIGRPERSGFSSDISRATGRDRGSIGGVGRASESSSSRMEVPAQSTPRTAPALSRPLISGPGRPGSLRSGSIATEESSPSRRSVLSRPSPNLRAESVNAERPSDGPAQGRGPSNSVGAANIESVTKPDPVTGPAVSLPQRSGASSSRMELPGSRGQALADRLRAIRSRSSAGAPEPSSGTELNAQTERTSAQPGGSRTDRSGVLNSGGRGAAAGSERSTADARQTVQIRPGAAVETPAAVPVEGSSTSGRGRSAATGRFPDRRPEVPQEHAHGDHAVTAEESGTARNALQPGSPEPKDSAGSAVPAEGTTERGPQVERPERGADGAGDGRRANGERPGGAAGPESRADGRVGQHASGAHSEGERDGGPEGARESAADARGDRLRDLSAQLRGERGERGGRTAEGGASDAHGDHRADAGHHGSERLGAIIRERGHQPHVAVKRDELRHDLAGISRSVQRDFVSDQHSHLRNTMRQHVRYHDHCDWWLHLLQGYHAHHHHSWLDYCHSSDYWSCWTPYHYRIVTCTTPLRQRVVWYFGLECVLIPDLQALGVQGVSAGSPAADAGLQEGDLILSVNGQTLTDDGVLQELITASAGRLELEVFRDGMEEAQIVVVQLRRLVKVSY